MLDNTYNQDDTRSRHLAEGTPVYDVNGDKVGSVSEQRVQGDNLVLQRGLIFPHDYSVPLRAVARADADGIYLNVTKDDVLNQTFDDAMTANTLDSTPDYSDTATSYQTSDRNALGYSASDQRADSTASHHETPPRDGDVCVPVYEEQLNIGKQQAEAGRVHVHKDVIEEQQAAKVPVTHEEVRVERVLMQGDATDLGSDAFTDRDIDVPLRGEQVVANKEAHVAEEVHLHKQQVTENQRIGDTVRKERIHIEGDSVDQGQGDVQASRDTVSYDQGVDDALPQRDI